MSRLGGIAVTISIVGGLLSACSQEPGADYCQSLKDEQTQLNKLVIRSQAGEGSTLVPTVAAYTRLRADAPDELRDEWDTVIFALQALADGLDNAGIDAAALDDPARFTTELKALAKSERDAVKGLAADVQSLRVITATRAIEDQALQVCDVVFGE